MKRASWWLLLSVMLLLAIAATIPVHDATAQGAGTVTDATVADGFSCSGGSAQGKLFESSGGCNFQSDYSKIFSNFVCVFEGLVSDLFGDLYCGMQSALLFPVQAALTLMIVITGVAFLTGMKSFTAKELAILMTKFALVWVFATQAEYAIGVAYKFFMTAIKETINYVLVILYPSGGGAGGDMFTHLDDMVASVIHKTGETHGSGTAEAAAEADGTYSEGDQKGCRNGLLALSLALAVAMPPIFLAVVFITFKLLWAVIRAIFGYALGLLGVTFLMTVSPIFFSFALFRYTRGMFDTWMQHLISYSLQMLVVFAFLALAFKFEIRHFFESFLDLIVPWEMVQQDGGAQLKTDGCTFCQFSMQDDPKSAFEMPVCNTPLKPLDLPTLSTNMELMETLARTMLVMAVLAYIIDQLLDLVPSIARSLAGPLYAPSLGGGKMGSGEVQHMNLPGEQMIDRGLSGFQERLSSRGGLSGYASAFGGGISDAFFGRRG